VPIFALETHGSNCFFEAMAANRGEPPAAPDNIVVRTDAACGVKVARLHRLTSKAMSLGASEASAGVVKLALARPGSVRCITVPDEMSMQTVMSFVGRFIRVHRHAISRAECRPDDHKILVELACATALAPAYSPGLMPVLLPPVPGRARVLIFVVCGGFKISIDDLAGYAAAIERDTSEAWTVKMDGGREVSAVKWT
jgi:L-serine/L-threonine ammonia-lyase